MEPWPFAPRIHAQVRTNQDLQRIARRPVRTLLTGSEMGRQRKQDRRRRVMDAKYNWLIDNLGVRVMLNVAAFGLWLFACALLLSLT